MPIPDFQSLMLPVLEVSAEGEQTIANVVERLAERYALTSEERAQLLPSGKQTTFANRVGWSKSYLKKAGLVHHIRRGVFTITESGQKVLSSKISRIDVKFLETFPEFQDFRIDKTADLEQSGPSSTPAESLQTLTPDEVMRQKRDQLEEELGKELLARVLASPPSFFERLVVKLLIAMGYGGSIEEAGRALGGSGDGGVDGVIDEDALGLDRIYVQAKRYAQGSTVSPADIRNFFGALDQFKANKGLFVTTSSFTSAAVQTSKNLSKRIVLIDGVKLSALMIRYGVGCRVEETLYIKKLDEDYFE